MTYTISRRTNLPEPGAAWDGPYWGVVPALPIENFRPESSDHRPVVRARLVYTDEALSGLFRVEDQYVRAVATGFHDNVCRDSCVEFFFKPDRGEGYFNFEFSCGGAMLCFYVTDPNRLGLGPVKGSVPLDEMLCRQVRIDTSLPERIEPEIAEPTTWTLGFTIPYSVLEAHTGPLGDLAGRTWMANLYKCGDKTSHPHWASWNPVDELNFHLPRCFAPLIFEA